MNETNQQNTTTTQPQQKRRRRSSGDGTTRPIEDEDESRNYYEWFLRNLDAPLPVLEDEADEDFVLDGFSTQQQPQSQQQSPQPPLPPTTPIVPTAIVSTSYQNSTSATNSNTQQSTTTSQNQAMIIDEDADDNHSLRVPQREVDLLLSAQQTEDIELAHQAAIASSKSISRRTANVSVIPTTTSTTLVPIAPAETTPTSNQTNSTTTVVAFQQQEDNALRYAVKTEDLKPAFTQETLISIRTQFTNFVQLSIQAIVSLLKAGNLSDTRSICSLLDECTRCYYATVEYKRVLSFCVSEYLGSSVVNLETAFYFPYIDLLRQFTSLFLPNGTPTLAMITPIIERLAETFSVELKVCPCSVSEINNSRWLNSEDLLLISGLEYYDRSWFDIQKRLLPSKTVEQIANRFKNQTAKNALDNPIKRFNENLPLTEQEQKQLLLAVSKLGPNFDLISKYLMTNKNPKFLGRCWRHWKKAQEQRSNSTTKTTANSQINLVQSLSKPITNEKQSKKPRRVSRPNTQAAKEQTIQQISQQQQQKQQQISISPTSLISTLTTQNIPPLPLPPLNPILTSSVTSNVTQLSEVIQTQATQQVGMMARIDFSKGVPELQSTNPVYEVEILEDE